MSFCQAPSRVKPLVEHLPGDNFIRANHDNVHLRKNIVPPQMKAYPRDEKVVTEPELPLISDHVNVCELTSNLIHWPMPLK